MDKTSCGGATLPGSRAILFDISGPVGAVGVALDGRMAGRAELEARSHGSRLLPTMARLLAEAGIEMPEVTDIVVGEGPGSFTGLRVAAATAKGLARALDARLWPVSSLAAAALGRTGARAARYVLFDARKDRVFGGCFLEIERRWLIPPHAGTVREALRRPPPREARFCGDGALRHADLVAEAGFEVLPPPAGVPSVDGLLRFLELDGGGTTGTSPHAPLEPVPPASWEPRYLRPWRAQRPRTPDS